MSPTNLKVKNLPILGVNIDKSNLLAMIFCGDGQTTNDHLANDMFYY